MSVIDFSTLGAQRYAGVVYLYITENGTYSEKVIVKMAVAVDYDRRFGCGETCMSTDRFQH